MEKEKEMMERIIKKADNPKVAEAAAIFASGYAAGMSARPEPKEERKEEGEV